MAKAAPSAPRHLRDFKSESLRGTPGFVRVGRTPAGQWWFIDGRNRPFFSRGVAGVNRYGRAGLRPAQAGPYEMTVARLHGVEDPRLFGLSTFDRLRAWHCNTLGPWSAPEFFGSGFFFTETVGFRHAAPESIIKLGGALLPDVFDPRWVTACHTLAAAVCPAQRGSEELLGYITDHGLQWAQPPIAAAAMRRPDRPTLLQICLSLEPSFPAYHAAWEFALAPHAGELTTLAAAWGIEPNKEALRQLTLADTPLTGENYRRDHERFTREFARRYMTTCAAAIRSHDPNHLVLGCDFESSPSLAVLAEFAYPAVDVLTMACRTPAVFEAVDRIARVSAMPVLITDFTWVGEEFTRPEKTPAHAATAVERMLSRGRATLARACTHPAAIGYTWASWADEPEDLPPFGRGLVHLDDREAREHTELLTEFNRQAEALRRRAAIVSTLPSP